MFTAHDDQFKFRIKSDNETITYANNMIKVLGFEEADVVSTVIF